MMTGWLRYFALTATARTGFSAGVVVWFLIALIALAVTFGLLCQALFVWLNSLFGPLIATLIMAGGFFLVAVIAAIAGALTRRHNLERARLELAARKTVNWLDPKLLSVALEVGRAIGWRRLISLAGAGVFAVGIAREWFGRDKGDEPGRTDG